MTSCFGRLALLCIAIIASGTSGAELVTTAGKKIDCELTSIGEKKIDIRTGNRTESLLLTQLLQIDFQPVRKEASKDKSIAVELLDGSRFRAASFRVKGRVVEVELAGSAVKKPISIPLAQIFSMFREADTLKMAMDFQGFVKKRGKRDIMVVKKGETLDAVEGTFGEANEAGDSIQFEVQGGVGGGVKLSRMAGMIFNQPPDGERPSTLCKLTDKSGNLFVLKSVQIEGEKLKWATVTGIELADYPLSDLARLDFSSGTLRYLSDLDATSIVSTSTSEYPERPARDTNLDRREISMKKEKFVKGLTIPSRNVLTFDVENFREFRAVVGVDDELEADSRAILKIEADGKVIHTQTVSKADPNKALTLGIANVKTLRITVESELLDLGNQVTLGDARVIK